MPYTGNMICAALLLSLQFPADLAIVNTRVWTDGHLTSSESVGVREGRFIYVGSRKGAPIGPKTKIIDAHGRLLTPGLIDSHTHMVEGGVSLLLLQLREAKGKADFIARVQEAAKELKPGEWLQGGGWSAESWPEKVQPRKEWIDPVTGDHPTVLERMDGHSVLVNSAALKLAKIDRNGPKDPAGGTIDRDENGEPTGILRERAAGMVLAPMATPAQAERGLRAAIKMANEVGVTSSSDICSTYQFPMALRVIQSTQSFRFVFYARTGSSWSPTIKAVKDFKGSSGWAEAKGLKAYMDGSLGSRTAYMHEPFSKPLPGQKELRGLPMPGFTSGLYAKGIPEAAESGLQVIVHAIGDQANHEILDLFAKVPETAKHRFRVEHVQHLLPTDIIRFGQMGIIPSMQPYHKADDGRYCEEVIGTERSRSSYTFHSLFASHARLAFGSDWPVVTINPWEGIATAVTGRILTGKIWMPQENITFDEALTCYTSNAAYAMGWEKEIGRIAVGYRADFVILDQDPYRPGVDLAKLKPTSVFIQGKSVLPADTQTKGI